MHAMTVKLRLDSPLLLTGIGNGEENSGVTLSYIPGVALRGGLIGMYLEDNREKMGPKTNPDRWRLFFSGEVRFLNGYPETSSKHRALPTPVSWYQKKHKRLKDSPEIYDFALHPRIENTEQVSEPFCGVNVNPETDFTELFNVKQKVSPHIAGEERGLVSEDNNLIFRNISVTEGQVFQATIVANNSTDLKLLKDLLEKNKTISLGRSRTAEYARVIAEPLECKEGWKETGETPEEDLDGRVVITLLSDMLLRNKNGQPTKDLGDWLAWRLNNPKIVLIKALIQIAVVGGFNRTWQLPLHQGAALGMGSVFVLSGISAKELQPLVEAGIGERRVDGFGRIALNWPGREIPRGQERGDPEKPLPICLSEGSIALARQMANRMLREKLEEAVLAASRRLEVDKAPPNSQLARLRKVVHQAIREENAEGIRFYFDDRNIRETARKHFERARVGLQGGQKKGLKDWIIDRAWKLDAWVILPDVHPEKLPKVANQSAEVNDTLELEYTLRLVDAVLARAMRVNRSKGE